LRGNRTSRERTRQAICYHYDLPVEFWREWLDPQLVYSCAYFRSPEESLDTAQANKLDYICRKLEFRPGEHFLDLGCGWGALVCHAARHYGVHASGITLSPLQADYSTGRIEREGLASRCRIVLGDFREERGEGLYDKIASVGAIEHVAPRDLPAYFQRAFNLLRRGGRFFNQGIVWPATKDRRRGPSFVQNYVFPDGHLETLHETLRHVRRHQN
jgi:cyclopropane-fatty-acyl-phospholipid synthase